MKSSTIIFRIVVFLIVLCMIGFSVLSVSDIFPDILIEPKWYFSLIFALSIVSIFAIIRLTSNYCINVEVLLCFFIGSVTLISLVELVISAFKAFCVLVIVCCTSFMSSASTVSPTVS